MGLRAYLRNSFGGQVLEERWCGRCGDEYDSGGGGCEGGRAGGYGAEFGDEQGCYSGQAKEYQGGSQGRGESLLGKISEVRSDE